MFITRTSSTCSASARFLRIKLEVSNVIIRFLLEVSSVIIRLKT